MQRNEFIEVIIFCFELIAVGTRFAQTEKKAPAMTAAPKTVA